MTRSALYCGHANENPSFCMCSLDCYCYEHTCKWRKPVKKLTMTRVWVPSDVPQGHHYAVITYNDEVIHWVTEDKATWEEFIKGVASSDREQFVFFEVTKLGKLTKTVTLNIE